MNAVHNIHTHLNLNGNEVRNVRLEGLPSDPDPVEGGVYFNLETGEFRFSDGTAWKSLLGGFWKLDEDGNLVTDRNVIIKKNITIGGDMSTDGEGGQGTVTGVTSIIIDGVPYFAEDGAIDISEAFEGLDVDVDLSDYYTKSETIGLVNTAIANLVNGAPETLDTLKEVADALAENADVVDALNAAIGNKADKATTLAGYGITDAYTRTEIDTKYSPVKTWYDELATLIVKEGSNVRIKTNIIIDGDQSATGEGGGTVIGITGIAVNGQTYTDTNNEGIIDLGTISGGGGGDIDLSDYLTKSEAQNTYLAKSGGTISGAAVLDINRSDGPYSSLIKFSNRSGELGYIGFSPEKNLSIWNDLNSAAYTVIHSGNYANYALPLSGGTLSNGEWASQLILNGKNNYPGIKFTINGTSRGYLYVYEDNSLNWYTENGLSGAIIHSGNIGSQTVATANSVYSPNGKEMVVVNDSATVEVFGSVAYDTYVDGKTLTFRHGSSYATAMTIDSSGDISISKTLMVGQYDGSLPTIKFRTLGEYLDGNGNLVLSSNSGSWNVFNTDRYSTLFQIERASGAVKVLAGNLYLSYGMQIAGGITRTSTYATSVDEFGNIKFNELASTGARDWSIQTTSGAKLLMVNNSGNVLIGTTVENGSRVVIKHPSASVTSNASAFTIDSAWHNWGYDYTSMSFAYDGVEKGVVSWNSVPRYVTPEAGFYIANKVSNERICLANEGGIYMDGRVFIGTTADWGYKLQVNGTTQISNTSEAALLLRATEKGSYHYAVIRAFSQDVDFAAIHFFPSSDDATSAPTGYRDTINLGAEAVSVGPWDNPVMVVHSNTKHVGINGNLVVAGDISA